MIEAEKRVHIHLPPWVSDGTIMEMPIQGLGIHTFYLRLAIHIAA